MQRSFPLFIRSKAAVATRLQDIIIQARPNEGLGPEAPAFKPESHGAGGIQMLRNRFTASSGDPGSSHGPVLATTHFPLEAAAHTR
jgi:hypothetical protein